MPDQSDNLDGAMWSLAHRNEVEPRKWTTWYSQVAIKSYAHTFRCLALLRWWRMRGMGPMWAIVGKIFYCPLLNSESPLICNVGKQQKDHKPRSLNYWFFANERVLFFAMPFLHYKGFALTVHLKTAKCEFFRSSANCQVRIFAKQF